ncbi:PREDICTED: geranylgeranyl transferase type-2 subunit alpha isoform X1 [Rhagoletis zephyria]|uniref:geranylgeranyl transferase type-2 subunit alpha isoform X1 n=1 Tax=Rhagoletis zephyria TaxID=28612 RepID=UPI00081155B5|nr:PREDICTED: geranylgeranyl transferase type-2 subunit alpha isoform X1 [Rhagoletis zephyria]
MHGRLKVRTTEEERERKKKEQALKVKAYNSTMSKIQDKRRRKELDDEMLQLTSQILLRNPDVTTLWNIRRECVEKKTNLDQKNGVYDAELNFSEQCLLVNPKSYNGWHHRCWILEHSPNANWEREVQLCSKYLKMDERNFHTWDYRRYVAVRAQVSRQNELDFCTEKIKANFSNYSSWHHRSLLLPILYPYKGDTPKQAMSESKLREELEMVLTAAFTDPKDSSAWFYQRWLLGYSRQELDVCAFRHDNNHAVIAFTNPIILGNANIALTDSNNSIHIKLKNWKPLNGTEADTTWVYSQSNKATHLVPDINDTILNIKIPDIEEKRILLKPYNKSVFYFKQPNQSLVFTGSILNELQSQLESCQSLLEYEPDSKWTLLTSALLMRAIDPQRYHDKSLQILATLQKVDALRKNYYLDMSSKWILEKGLSDWADSQDVPKTLDLRHEERLNALFYQQYFCIVDNVLLPENLNHCINEVKNLIHTSYSLVVFILVRIQ